VVVKLEVPAGVPAIYQESPLPGQPGSLLLGRGLRWEVCRVVPVGAQLLVTGRVVPR
jgi:hypothetical protein